MSIVVSNISKIYEKQKALNNVSFAISAGEIVGFLGPNGAGKSTMMKIITCFIPQTEGRAEVCGYDTLENAIEVRRKVGYLPEHNPLYLDMYVKEYLAFVGGLHHIKGNTLTKQVSEMIGRVGLQVEQNKKIGALSKGYRQRVGLAQALIHDPQVLVLDEPTTGLDPNQLAEIRMLIKEVGKEKTVLLSTHIMQEVKAVCDRIMIINKGEIVANDTTEHLQQSSKNRHYYIQVEFTDAIAIDLLKALEGVEQVTNVGKNTWQLTTRIDIDSRNDLFQLAVKHNTSILSMQRKEDSLETIFQQLTNP